MTAQAFCPKCGTARAPGAAFCGTCGQSFDAPVTPPAPTGPNWVQPAPKMKTVTPFSGVPTWLVGVLAIVAILVALYLYGAIPKLS